MMKKQVLAILSLVGFLFILAVSCASSPPEEKVEEKPAEKPPVEEQKKEAPAEEKEEVVEKEKEPEKKEETKVEPPPPEETKKEEFEATEELISQTFDDIEAIIEQLNSTISKRDYDTWLTYLTENYIEKTSEQSNLDKYEPKQIEKLTSLKDYFDYIVVPTRSRVNLDEIEFEDDRSLFAYTVLRGQKYILYYLVKVEKDWKIEFYK